MKRKQGFTLVELLVVIGIIALLISILLPSLNRARWQAQVTACSARMRDLVLAVQMYANDNKGALPPANGDLGKADYDIWNGNSTSILYTEAFGKVNNANNATAFTKDDPGALLGRLWKTNYLKTSKVFTCPSTKEPGNTERYGRDFNYYVFNPHVKRVTANVGGVVSTPTQFWWKRLPNYGRVPGALNYSVGGGGTNTEKVVAITPWTRAIMVDPLWSYSSALDKSNQTHATGNKRAVNFAYPDGSVRSYISDNIAGVAVRGSGGNGGNAQWAAFLDLSNAMQAAVDGQNVNWRDTASWQNKDFNAIPVNP